MRVIAIDKNVFTYEIEGKIENRSHPDARLLKPNYLHVHTADCVRKLCCTYLEAAGLRYGVFDLALVSGQSFPYFFECNPEGQWQSALGRNLNEVVERFCDLVERAAC